MKKQIPAILAALLITMCLGAGMLLVGTSALLNKNGVPVANSAAQITATAQVTTAQDAQLQQMQDLVNQYQQREQQYQQQLNTAAQQIQQDQAQLQQYQMLLFALQNRGIIQIGRDGRITIPQGNGN
jgi:TolA-binding protein